MDEAASDAQPLTSAANAPAPAVRPLSCPACGGTIEIKAAGYTVTLVCPYCSSILDVANSDVRLIERYERETRALDIPLGTRGTLKGLEWEAIGYLRRSENGSYPWEEYLLFNPYHGYRWLVTDGRGWTLGTMLTVTPRYAGDGLEVDGEIYQSFFRQGRAQVDSVIGEFYWRVTLGEQADTADYVRPGWMLSFEGTASERNWTLGELLDPAEIADAFGVDPPPRWSPGGPPPLPHQPSPYARSIGTFFKMALVGLAALCIIFALFGGTSRKQSYDLTVRTPGLVNTASDPVTATVGPVTLDRPYQSVTINAQAAGLDNAWVDLDYTLVNRKTQESFGAYGVTERYSGVDSDGSWSEGSGRATTKMAMVPRGDYDLVVDASAQKWGFGGSDAVNVAITVAQGGSFWSNFLIALLLLGIPAILILIKQTSFEAARMGESDQGSALGNLTDEDDDE